MNIYNYELYDALVKYHQLINHTKDMYNYFIDYQEYKDFLTTEVDYRILFINDYPSLLDEREHILYELNSMSFSTKQEEIISIYIKDLEDELVNLDINNLGTTLNFLRNFLPDLLDSLNRVK